MTHEIAREIEKDCAGNSAGPRIAPCSARDAYWDAVKYLDDQIGGTEADYLIFGVLQIGRKHGLGGNNEQD